MKLNEKIALEWWMESLNGTLGTEKEKGLQTFLRQNPDWARDLEQNLELWQDLGNLPTPEPAKSMDDRFFGMLQGYQSRLEGHEPWFEKFIQWLTPRWKTATVSMAIGLILALVFLPARQQEVSQLTSEIRNMKQLLMLTMLEKPEANSRIKAINISHELSNADTKVIDALISALNNDPSINVRLAALESLLQYANQPVVREELVKSITIQESPLVQVALADAMLLIKEKRAIKSFEQLMDSTEVQGVRSKLKSTIQTLKEI